MLIAEQQNGSRMLLTEAGVVLAIVVMSLLVCWLSFDLGFKEGSTGGGRSGRQGCCLGLSVVPGFVRSSLKILWTVQKEKYFKCMQWSCAGHSNVKL